MVEQIISKRCSRCKQIKPLSEFYKNRSEKDGHSFYCKVCHKKYAKEYSQTARNKTTRKRYQQSDANKFAQKHYRQSEKGKVAHSHYRQSEKGKSSHRRVRKIYSLKFPEKNNARKAVREAIKEGQLPPPKSLKCSCGEPAKEYHHPNYAPEHWLDVIALCIKCHKIALNY